jgi:hypothetical protein
MSSPYRNHRVEQEPYTPSAGPIPWRHCRINLAEDKAENQIGEHAMSGGALVEGHALFSDAFRETSQNSVLKGNWNE